MDFVDYDSAWRWSVNDIEGFWKTIWEYFNVRARKETGKVLEARKMPGAKWFVGAELNFADHFFRSQRNGPALIYKSENDKKEVSWAQLQAQVSSVAASLRRMGVSKGDRVAAYLPNRPETIVAMLATASLGAVWSSCSLDFGAPSVLDRFKQIEPKVLLVVDGYYYGGKRYDKRQTIGSIVSSLPTLKGKILVQGDEASREIADFVTWDSLLDERAMLSFEPVPFDHPLWILYSSGTTGLPKPIVHGHGGILLEHLKAVGLHNDVKPNDRMFWFTTTGWMMWNYLLAGLLMGATLVLYDGSPAYPDMNALWDLAEDTGITFFGASAAYVSSCMKARISPKSTYGLRQLRGFGSTGSPLPPEGFEWLYREIKDDLWVASVSGGTDLCTPFVGGCPILPVFSGEIQCRYLGAKVESYSERGTPVIGEVGELVITEPMPSMPIYFWGDVTGGRYRESYFETFPGVWRHGDWIKINGRGTCVIYGRSDATIKRMGVRIGTSEIYRIVESIPEVTDSLVIDVETQSGSTFMPLFVVMAEGSELDETRKKMIGERIRRDLSPRYVPDEILAVPAIPRTLNGKKLEVPIKRLFMRVDPAEAFSKDSLANPESTDAFIEYARRLGKRLNR